MRLKRLAAVLLAVPLLHLNVARAAIACDRHEEAGTASVEGEHEAHGEHAMHGAQLAEKAPTADHELPASDSGTAECCQALASCSLAFGAGDVQTLDRPTIGHSRTPSSLSDDPPTRISAPEPPPPKA